MVLSMTKVDVEISPLAFSKIIDWTSSNTEREVGGYLIGFIDNGKVIITDSTFAVISSTPTHVQLDEMAQFRIIEEIEKRGGKETITGFWHTHPGIGCFMSGTDIATQKVYQALLPEAIAMVNDGNKFARTRNQNDFEAHFYRVNNDNRAVEINFGLITNPNELVNILTEYVQSEESISNAIQSTANAISIDIQNNVVSKKEFTKEITQIKKAVAKTRSDLEVISEKNESFIKKIEEITTLRENQQMKRFKILLYFLLGFMLIAIAGWITVLIVLLSNP